MTTAGLTKAKEQKSISTLYASLLLHLSPVEHTAFSKVKWILQVYPVPVVWTGGHDSCPYTFHKPLSSPAAKPLPSLLPREHLKADTHPRSWRLGPVQDPHPALGLREERESQRAGHSVHHGALWHPLSREEPGNSPFHCLLLIYTLSLPLQTAATTPAPRVSAGGRVMPPG